MRTEEEINRIAYEIRGAALSIHRALGPGCFESAYAPCLAYELRKRKLGFEQKVPLSLHYEELTIERAYEPDFRVEECVIIEVKALEVLTPIHGRQVRTYLRLSGCPLGLLINFGAIQIFDGITRIVNNFPEGTPPYSDRRRQASGTSEASGEPRAARLAGRLAAARRPSALSAFLRSLRESVQRPLLSPRQRPPFPQRRPRNHARARQNRLRSMCAIRSRACAS